MVGGTIAFADGQTLAISTSFNNRLTGVTITGDLVMNIAGAVLRISGGLTVNGGAIRMTGDATTLAYEGTQTWSTGAVFFEGSTGGRRIIEAVNGGTTLTLGSSFTVHGSGDLGGSRLFGNNLTLLNGGTIQADVSGQSLNIPSRVTLTNSGTLQAVNGGSLSVSTLTADHAGTFRAGVNSLVQVNGALSQRPRGCFPWTFKGWGLRISVA